MEEIKNNMTTSAIAEKNSAPLPGRMADSVDIVNNAVETIGKVDIPNVHRVARLADVAKREHTAALEALDVYDNQLDSDHEGFSNAIADLSRPKDTIAAIQQSGFQAALIQGGKGRARELARSDAVMAAAALELPASLAATVGLDNREILKERLFPGYGEEKTRYETLKENSANHRLWLQDKIGNLHNSREARQAVKDIAALGDL